MESAGTLAAPFPAVRRTTPRQGKNPADCAGRDMEAGEKYSAAEKEASVRRARRGSG